MSDFEKRLACVIKADGTIARGYMIESCKRSGANEYIITWKIPLQGEAKTNFAGTIGSAAGRARRPRFHHRWIDERPETAAGSYLRHERQAGRASVSHRCVPRPVA
jgi:hypothetical protein